MKKFIKGLMALLLITTLGGCSLFPGNSETAKLSQSQLWEKLQLAENEAWSSGEYYVYFGKDGSDYTYRQARITNKDKSIGGVVSGFRYQGKNVYELTVRFSDGDKKVTVEYNPESVSQRIRVLTYLDNGSETQNHTYKPVTIGDKPVDPVDPTPVDPTPIDPDPTPVDPGDKGLSQSELWTKLAAADSWTNEEEEFVDFLVESNSYKYMESTWGAGEGMGYGETDEFRYEGNGVYVFTAHWVLDDYEEETSEQIDGVVRVVYNNKFDYITVTPYNLSEARYFKDVNSQMSQSQVWSLINGTWACESNGTEYEFAIDQMTGEAYINYKTAQDAEPRRAVVTDFHGQHYVYSFAMIIYGPSHQEIPENPENPDIETGEETEILDDDEVMYSSMTFDPNNLTWLEIDDHEYLPK